MMLEALQNIDYCNIFSTYKKRWAAEDMMKSKFAFQEKDVNNKRKKETISSGDILAEQAQEESKIEITFI